MMKLTIGSEAVFFLSLIVAYLYFWRSGHIQQQVAEHLNAKLTGLFTMFLLSSSFTFWRAEKNYEQGNSGRMKMWLGATLVLGLVFLFGRGHEYYNLISEGVVVSQNEFASSFYTLTGFHGLHVLIGLLIISIMLVLMISGALDGKDSSIIRAVGIYWHFVDAVWIFVFTTIYLLPYIL